MNVPPPLVADQRLADAAFAAEVLGGLRAHPKQLPAKFFYDDVGAALFEEICELPEYYPTRTELGILRAHVGEMAQFLGTGCQLIEYGSGAGVKIRLLLEALRPSVYFPIDISYAQLQAVAAQLTASYPWLTVSGIAADYTQPFALPHDTGGRKAVFFPGSTVGNFTLAETQSFLRQAHALVGPGGAMILGVDTKKDKAVLDAAYDDAAGITARFNLNILAHINKRLGAQFDLTQFRHVAFYSPERGQIEMYLKAENAHEVDILGQSIGFATGEMMLTEISRKYAIEEMQALAQQCGWRAARVWTDANAQFSVHGLEAL
jgi:L-histidine Nalpha-methyltransferase